MKSKPNKSKYPLFFSSWSLDAFGNKEDREGGVKRGGKGDEGDA
jgi:hypothetical protein